MPLASARTLLVAVSLPLAAACGDSREREPGGRRVSLAEMEAVPHVTGEDLAEGQALYARYCGSCHGEEAGGTAQGPPLVHRVYEPSHHSDFAFMQAALRGVRAHHWQFGDMPPVPGIEPGEVAKVTAYIRHLQREAGIF